MKVILYYLDSTCIGAFTSMDKAIDYVKMLYDVVEIKTIMKNELVYILALRYGIEPINIRLEIIRTIQ